jgi:ATP-dependent protease HslVU (ClpYQ) peptidase subunit
MTTIVVSQKQRTMVADSLVTGGGPAVTSIKIFEVDGKLVGVCGTLTHCIKFVEWMKHGTPPVYAYDKEVNTFEALVLSADGLTYYDKELVAIELFDDVVAIGSGSAFAIGAIDAGASLQKAVEIAADRDEYSGLPVIVRKLAKRKR